jgi:hypothetical protein
MLSFKPKIEDFGFVILCPERNYGGLKATARSIQGHFPDRPHICITIPEADHSEIKEFNEVCPTFVAGKTYTSMLNTGIRENKSEWAYFIMAGQHIRSGQLKLYNRFCVNQKTVMYPILDKMWMFHESSINGLLIHKSAIAEVGLFEETEDDFNNIRLMWANSAIDKGYKFIALVGVPR